MSEGEKPQVYSIAAHRGFADALVAGLVPRYAEENFGLARLTLLLPSARAARTLSEAFVRHAGATDNPGLLMPRMVMVGDLDLDEALGPLVRFAGRRGGHSARRRSHTALAAACAICRRSRTAARAKGNVRQCAAEAGARYRYCDGPARSRGSRRRGSSGKSGFCKRSKPMPIIGRRTPSCSTPSARCGRTS